MKQIHKEGRLSHTVRCRASQADGLCDGVDYVTQDMVIGILGGEEDHRREFIGILMEYEKR